MLAQGAGGSRRIRGVAEHLPFGDDAFEAAMAILTVHHWADPSHGLAELRRVARRQVIFTWDPDHTQKSGSPWTTFLPSTGWRPAVSLHSALSSMPSAPTVWSASRYPTISPTDSRPPIGDGLRCCLIRWSERPAPHRVLATRTGRTRYRAPQDRPPDRAVDTDVRRPVGLGECGLRPPHCDRRLISPRSHLSGGQER